MALSISSYVYWFYIALKLPFSHDPATWGQFGDFIGGLLNPLIAYLAFYWLITSVRIQKQELKETREELCEARKAQELQAKTQLLASEISGYRTRLEVITTKLHSIRSDIEFVRESVRSGRYVNRHGEWLQEVGVKADLAALLEDARLYGEMSETVDKHIKQLLERSEQTLKCS